MTKTITFNFIHPSLTAPQSTGVSFNDREIESPAAKKSIEEMNALVKRYLPYLKEKEPESYELLIKCPTFTASIELPPDEGKILLIFKGVVNNVGVKIQQTLSNETVAPLKLRSLVQLSSSSSRSTPPLIHPLLSADPHPTAVIPADEPKTMYQKIEQKKPVATPPPSTPPQGLISRIIAWILSFFVSSKTSPAATEKSSLLSQPITTSYLSTATQVVAGIRPLRNGNNICFINAIFQALMNIPEMKAALIAAHENKIAREIAQLESLQLAIALEESTYIFPWSSSPDRPKMRALEASKEASITFNQALRTYGDKSQEFVYLNSLRGFIEGSLGGWQQEDANDLLIKIFEPLIYLVEHPVETTPDVLAYLQRIVFEFGEQKRLEQYVPQAEESEARRAALAKENDPIELSRTRILGKLENSLIVPLHIPNQKEKVHLQPLLQSHFTMSKTPEQDDPCICKHKGEKGWYQVSEKRLAISTKNGAAPEFVTLQLVRFRKNSDGTLSKIHTEIELPQDGKVKLTVNGFTVNYEIHTLVQHSGDTMDGGHYFSYVRKDGAWVEANDTTVAKLDKLPSSTPNQVYMIFLKKV